MGMSTGTVVLLLVVVVVGLGAAFMFGGGQLFQAAPGPSAACVSNADCPTGQLCINGACTIQTTSVSLCGDDGIGHLAPSFRNSLNQQANEYLPLTVRIYDQNGNFENQSTAATSSAWAGIECTQCGQPYTFYAFINGTRVHTSTGIKGTMECKEKNVETFDVQQRSKLKFRVYDEVGNAYIYPTNATNDARNGNGVAPSTLWQEPFNYTNSTILDWCSTTAFTVTTLGVGDEYIYTIWLKTNNSNADTTWTDRDLMFAVDAGDTAEWNEPSFTAAFTVTKVDCPTKISNDLYDWCYLLTSGGDAVQIDKDMKSLTMSHQLLPGVSPTADNITVALFTSGYFQSIVGEDVMEGYTKNNPQRSWVHEGARMRFIFKP